MATVPTPRVDKNGNTVTRHMNPDKGKPKSDTRTPKAKPPTAKPLDVLPEGWSFVTEESGAPRYEVVVENPAGTAQYRVWIEQEGVERGDVFCRLTDLSTQLTGSFRSFTNLNATVESTRDTDRQIRIYRARDLPPDFGPQIAPPIADFKDFADDDAVVTELVRARLIKTIEEPVLR